MILNITQVELELELEVKLDNRNMKNMKNKNVLMFDRINWKEICASKKMFRP